MGRRGAVGLAAAAVCMVLAGSVAAAGATKRGAKQPPDPLAQVAGPWVQVTGADTVFAGGQVGMVTQAGRTLVAVGTVGASRAIWTSADGLRWSRVPDASLGLTPDQLAVPPRLTPYSEFLVAGDDLGVTVVAKRTVVFSRDGTTWEKLADPASGTALRDPTLVSSFASPAEFVDFYLNALAVSGPTRSAVGWGCWCAPFQSGDRTPFAVASADGRTWTGGPLWGDTIDSGQMATIVATKDGFVAAGFDSRNNERNDAAVWRSPDGATWNRVEHATLVAPEAEEITQLAANGERLLGIGQHGAVAGSRSGWDFYRSDDGGVTWTRFAADPAVFGTTGPRSVFALGDGFVVLGASMPEGSVIPVSTAFTTEDGQTFTPAFTTYSMGPGGIAAIAERPDGLVTFVTQAAIGTTPASTRVYVAGKLAKKAVKAKLATPPTTTTLPKAATATSSR